MKNVTKREVYIGTERAGSSTHQTITDAETGEVLGEEWISKTKGKPGRKENDGAYFVKLYRTNLLQIVTEKSIEKKLDLNEAGLFFMLISISGWQTPYIRNPDTKELMSCGEIADFLGRDRKHVYNILEELISKGMVSKTINGNGRANYYMINPNIAFYGKTIDDLSHLDVFKTCPYQPKNCIKYKKTPEKKK